MKRISIALSVLVALGMLLSACQPAVTQPPETQPPANQPPAAQQEYPRNETIYVSGAAWGPASTWNPFQPGSLANTTGTIGFVYEFLFAFDPQTGKISPWLAESGAWSNATTYDVTLRKGLTWSDGKALTAADVVFTFELGKQHAALWFSPLWTYLTSVTAVDDTHVKFSFNNPLYQEWDNYLYNLPIVPKHLWESRTEEDINTGANEKPVGSGAYLYLTNAEDRNVWMRNENWWGTSVFGKPAPKYIVDIRFSSNNVALGSVLKGEVDLSNNFLPGVATLVDKGYVKTYFAKAPYMLSANTAVLFLNTTKKPMNDPAVPQVMQRRPRRHSEHILNRSIYATIAGSIFRTLIAYGLIFWVGLQFGGVTYARTMLFTSIVLHAFTRVMVVRQMDNLSLWSNRALLVSYAVAVGLQLLALYTPLRNLFGVIPLDWRAWAVMLPVMAGSSLAGIYMTRWLLKLFPLWEK